METSTDDDGDPATAQVRILLLCIALFLSFHPTYQPSLPPPQPITQEEPVIAKKTKVSPSRKRSKKLYLTFDDGPNRGTKNVLHIVQDEEVPVTFFVVGEHVFASAVQHQLWDSLRIARHIEICNHSYSHANGRYETYYQQPDSVVKDFKRTHDSLGLTNAVVRTPGRNIWRVDTLQYTDLKRSAAAADSLQKAGFVVMGWDLEWHFDHKTMSVTTAADDLVKQIDSAFAHRRMKIADHLVILAHDQVYQRPSDSQQLRTFLQLLKKKGDYEFALMTTYPLIVQDSLAGIDRQ
jgi:peptidoglycan/xylan/chitin deacetylase (PgdA/CDA1 family)